jgi:hypothetical protein
LVVFQIPADIFQVVDVHVWHPEVFGKLGVEREVDLARIPARIGVDRAPVSTKKSRLKPLDDEVEGEADGKLEVVNLNDLKLKQVWKLKIVILKTII